MDEVWSIIADHRARLGASGELERKRREQQRAWFWTMIDDGLKGHFLARDDVQRLLSEMETAVASARLTPTEAARRLLALLDEGGERGGRAAVRARRAGGREGGRGLFPRPGAAARPAAEPATTFLAGFLP